MLALRITVCPVDHATLSIPLVLAIEDNTVAIVQCCDARSEIDIVGDQQGLTGGKPEDKALVTAAVVVVGQNAIHHAFSADLKAALLSLECGRDRLIGRS